MGTTHVTHVAPHVFVPAPPPPPRRVHWSEICVAVAAFSGVAHLVWAVLR